MEFLQIGGHCMSAVMKPKVVTVRRKKIELQIERANFRIISRKEHPGQWRPIGSLDATKRAVDLLGEAGG